MEEDHDAELAADILTTFAGMTPQEEIRRLVKLNKIKSQQIADHDAALAAKDAVIAELRKQQLTLACDYDPNCDEFDFAYQREVMRSAFRIIEAAQNMAQSLGR